MSTLWGEQPVLLACGHLVEPFAGFKSGGYRECSRCVRELGEDARWQLVVAVAPDLDLTEGGT